MPPLPIVQFDKVSYGYASHGRAQGAGRDGAGRGGGGAAGGGAGDGGGAAGGGNADSSGGGGAAGGGAGDGGGAAGGGNADSSGGGPGSGGAGSGPSARPALDDLSLTVAPGEFVAVIGANGSGKSTLAKHINALLVPQSGRVLTLGLDTAEAEAVFEIRSHAGMVFQNPDSQMVTSVVADDVAFGPENLAVPYEELAARVDDALDAVKMTPFSQRNPAHLSGGQKQRVCIAGVLAMHPDVLILDEPGAMLDARGRRGIRRIVRELNRAGMTVILITHFMEEAVLADRVLAVGEGRIVLAGSPLEVFSQKQRLRELALDVPFSLLLAEELRARGLPVPEVARPEELKEALCSWYSTR